MQKSSLTTPNKTAPTTAEPSPAQQAQQQQQKAKKQVKWDSDILEVSESESDEEEEEKTNTRQASRKYHAAHDANYDTIVQGLALNDLEDSEESEGDDDIVDFDDMPYKRRKTNFGDFSYGQRAYGTEAKKIEKEKASIGCQRFCLLIKFRFRLRLNLLFLCFRFGELCKLLRHSIAQNNIIKNGSRQRVITYSLRNSITP